MLPIMIELLIRQGLQIITLHQSPFAIALMPITTNNKKLRKSKYIKGEICVSLSTRIDHLSNH